MSMYCGIDLHSNNNVIVLINQYDQCLIEKRLPNNLDTILATINSFRDHIHGIAVESTFNWYWLVDGLMDAGYFVHLVNTTAVQQYSGLKHTNDAHDAFWLAHLLRLGILPTGYSYPKELRGLRDLLRQRMLLVQHKTALVLSSKSHFERLTGTTADAKILQRTSADDIYLPKISDPNHQLRLKSSLRLIRTIEQHIDALEKSVIQQSKENARYEYLKTIPGVGIILGLAILLETGDVQRFPTVGNYVSYCRCVDATKTSNGKKKGQGNRKNGNKYLAWAFYEAAVHAMRTCPPARRFYQRKSEQRNSIVAMKALAHKLARAAFFILRDQVPFDREKLFS